MDKVRIDKWLWSVRIFKSRSMAAEACRSNQVKVDGIAAKPSAMVHRENVIQVRKDGFHLTFRCIDLIDRRVSAPLAQVCYEDLTPEEERNKYKSWFIGKARAEVRERGVGRPTKKERRILDTFKDEPGA
jgi:ribosome-associated heat shock protein Hsp15